MSIGVGMLALPVVTAAGGFIPSISIFLISWLFMVGFARLILEACTWMPRDSNLVTISRHLLGKWGAAACWILYLFLFYCLLTAHVAAGGDAVFQIFQGGVAKWLATLIYVALFAPVVYLGTNAVGRFNMILMTGVVLTYLLFFFTAIPHVQTSFLARSHWPAIWSAFPVILTSFGFQNLIPTLYNYMDGDHRQVRKALWIGTLIPLVLYTVWELLVLGVVPLASLSSALELGQSAIPPLQEALGKGSIAEIAQAFAFFSMTTSFIGIAIAFTDFWADGLKWSKKGIQHLQLFSLVFFIPLFIVLINPSIFLYALDLAGGIGMILLLGIMPILFAWSGRYYHGHALTRQFVPYGKLGLSVLFLFCIVILLIQMV
jgi:tyrosine-specific transport protein